MFEKKYNLLELFCLLIIEFYFKKRNFEDNFSSKISENNKTFLPLVKNQSTLLCIVYSIRTMTFPRYQPHTLFIMKKHYSGKERHPPSRVLFSQVF